ncbi:Conserved_hypothetical protein [Hexamita inflata]|uniref:HNH nuclease domain-containing protein n=1 Tax=Hexamita inflata TaxID=28002 RepID=A0AA86PIN3_9EUKA|nr:Conserved hypothetical protein [Hexamita inflata]CAI9935518.1 Conserved hypothetical protein [Hexamita inflata]CAI9936019.1 Conserved hypothetical protein [Hexamita inflata]
MYIREEVIEYKPIFDQSRAYSFIEALNDRKPDEQFKYVVGHQDLLISSFGRLVYNEDLTKRPPISMGSGYYQTSIDGVSIRIHRLVAQAFLGECPEDCEVDHIDRCRYNNQLTNLRYVSGSQNCMNRSSYKGHTAQYFTKLSDKCVPFKTYGRNTFDNFFIDTETCELYKLMNDKYLKTIVSYINNTPVYTLKTTLGKNTTIQIHRLKRGLYNLSEQDLDQSSSILFKSQ